MEVTVRKGLSWLGGLETLRFCGLQLATPAAFPESDTLWPSVPGLDLPMRRDALKQRQAQMASL